LSLGFLIRQAKVAQDVFDDGEPQDPNASPHGVGAVVGAQPRTEAEIQIEGAGTGRAQQDDRQGPDPQKPQKEGERPQPPATVIAFLLHARSPSAAAIGPGHRLLVAFGKPPQECLDGLLRPNL
jgi:hypothetical protein